MGGEYLVWEGKEISVDSEISAVSAKSIWPRNEDRIISKMSIKTLKLMY